MSSSAPRFSTPLDSPRPRGAGWRATAPRSAGARLFDRARFDQWLRMEADPTVLRLCERPMRKAAAPGSHVLDLWVERSDGERLLIVCDIDIDVEPFSPAAPGVPVQRIPAAELAAAAVCNQWLEGTVEQAPLLLKLAPVEVFHAFRRRPFRRGNRGPSRSVHGPMRCRSRSVAVLAGAGARSQGQCAALRRSRGRWEVPRHDGPSGTTEGHRRRQGLTCSEPSQSFATGRTSPARSCADAL